MGKDLTFQNIEVENFKNHEILWSKRDFFSFFSGDNFSYIHANKLKFSAYVLYWEFYRKVKNQIVIG